MLEAVVFDDDELFAPAKVVFVVMVAVTLVALVQTLGTVDVVPSTKLTAAHYPNVSHKGILSLEREHTWYKLPSTAS